MNIVYSVPANIAPIPRARWVAVLREPAGTARSRNASWTIAGRRALAGWCGLTPVYLWQHCGTARRQDSRTTTSHAEAVADLAYEFCMEYLKDGSDFVRPADRVIAEAVWHAGVLHELVEIGGATYDDICSVTNRAVADILCGASRDARLPRPRRAKMFIGQLQEAGPHSQLVVLADLTDELTAIQAQPLAKQLADDLWLVEAGDLLNSLHALRSHATLRKQLAASCAIARHVGEQRARKAKEEAEAMRLRRRISKRKALAKSA